MNKRSFFTTVSTALAAFCWWNPKAHPASTISYFGLERSWLRRRLTKDCPRDKGFDELKWEFYLGECPWKKKMNVEEVFPVLVRNKMEILQFPGDHLVRFKEFDNDILFTYFVDNHKHTCFLTKTELV